MPSSPSDLRATGDAMQSALSRIATFLRQDEARHPLDRLDIPYEVRMACIEGLDACDEWTALRRQDARPAPRRNRAGTLYGRPVMVDDVGAYSSGEVIFMDSRGGIVPTDLIQAVKWDG